MKNIVNSYVKKFTEEHRKTRKAVALLLALAMVVATGVSWQLHATGIALTNETYCGLEEHTHSADCYEEVLTCGLEESEGHTHTEDCYETETVLVCGKEESEGHTHTEDCYDEYGSLICGQEESEGHTHSDSCYETKTTLVCGKEESEGHTHSDACYEEQLVCGLEEHTHTVDCLTDVTADVETAADWEATLPELTGDWAADLVAVAQSQLGYAESTANFTLADDGTTRQGYTRYGAWYGNAYGAWDAMFVSFCLSYAGIPEESVPQAAGAYAWTATLSGFDCYTTDGDYTPAVGDIAFFDADGDGAADGVGIVSNVSGANMTVVQGDSGDQVAQKVYAVSEAAAFVDMTAAAEAAGTAEAEEADAEAEEAEEAEAEAETYTLTYEGEDYIVTATYGADAALPENVELIATEYAKDSENYLERYAESAELYGWDEEEDYTDSVRLFNIGFYDGDGLEVEPAAAVQVTITYLNQETESGSFTVTHFAEDGTETIETETEYADGEQTITFGMDSFSDIQVTAVSDDNTATVADEDSTEYTFTYSWNFTTGGFGQSGSSTTHSGSQVYTVYIVDKNGNIISSENITATSTKPSYSQTSNNDSYGLSTLADNFTVTVDGTTYTYQGAYLESTLETAVTSIRYGSSNNSDYSMQYQSSSSSGFGGNNNNWSTLSSTTIYLVYKDASQVDTSFDDYLESKFTHIDVKVALAESDSSTVNYTLYKVTSITTYSDYSNKTVANSETNDSTADDVNSEWSYFRHDFYGSYTIVITYTVSYVENGTTVYKDYTAVLDADSTYADGTYYPASGDNAYNLYNYLYGTSYTKDNWSSSGITKIDISGMSIYLVAAILCNGSTVSGQSLTKTDGLDFALDVGTLMKYSAHFDLEVQKNYNADMADGQFTFTLSGATVSEGTWTIGSTLQTKTNSVATASDGTSTSTIDFDQITYESTTAGTTT